MNRRSFLEMPLGAAAAAIFTSSAQADGLLSSGVSTTGSLALPAIPSGACGAGGGNSGDAMVEVVVKNNTPLPIGYRVVRGPSGQELRTFVIGEIDAALERDEFSIGLGH